jgi:hypothetical protein
MGECWARSVGGCGGKTSREHIVSKSLFASPEVTVHGLNWCKDQPKTVGIESLTAKILCQEHNSRLSPLDSAAGAAFDVLRQQTKLSNERQKLSPKTLLKVERFIIDARLLERWFLKTLLNLSHGSDFFIGVDGTEKGVPSSELVEICYGLRPFPCDAGMYVAANAGMTINMFETVSFSPLIKDGQRILGGFFEFRGIRFLLALMPEGLKYPLWSIPRIDQNWARAQLLRPFKKIKAKHGKYLSHTVEFRW